MTEVTFYQNEKGELLGFRSEGHSGYAEEGEDIICAAISALTINTVNSIQELTDDDPDLDVDEEAERPYIDLSFFEVPGKDSQLLLKSLALGIQNISENEGASEFIEVIYQEV